MSRPTNNGTNEPDMNDVQLTGPQVEQLSVALHAGVDDAAAAMARWLSVPSVMTLESLDQISVDEAVTLLGADLSTICLCAMQVSGGLNGQLVFAFDDDSGLALADLVLKQPTGSTTTWNDVAQSAALETSNIIGCSYLNALSDNLVEFDSSVRAIIPSPPVFRRDFAESLLQAVMMEQAVSSDTVLLTRVRFELNRQPLNWTLLMVPDPSSLKRLREFVPDE